VLPHLSGDDFLLESRQQLLRFRQGQTQSGDVTKTAGPIDLHDVLSLPLALGAGLGAGMVNGWLSVRLGVPSFLATLGMLEMARGATYLLTRSQTQYVGPRLERLAEASLFGLSLPFFAALVLVAAGEVALRRTVFGRHALAVGANEEAVRFSGVDPRPVKLAAFALCGLLSAAAGVVYAARLGAADPNAGIGFELSAIAAVVVGGTSLSGGRGSVIGSFLGVLVIAVLGAGLAQAGAQEPTKRLVTGAVIVLAVLADRLRRR
jgi:ribose transport system permease protein